MTAIAATPQDGEILSLFRQWIRVMRRYDELGTVVHNLIVSQQDRVHILRADADADAVLDEADEIERQIYDIPAAGTVGLAIKGYLLARAMRQEDLTPEDANGSLGKLTLADYSGDDGTLFRSPRTVRSFAEDAVRFVPELRPLVAGVVDAPVSLGNVVPLRPRKR